MTSPKPFKRERFGVAVSISREYAVVMTESLEGDSLGTGFIHFFQQIVQDPPTWEAVVTDTVTGLPDNLKNGQMMAMSKKYLVAGKKVAQQMGVKTGAFQVYTLIRPTDYDLDGIPNNQDNCRSIYNPAQLDSNNNGIGDACDPDLLNRESQDEKELKSMPISVSPNPSNGLINIQLESNISSKSLVQLININGQVLRDQELESTMSGIRELQWDLTEFPAGVYWLFLTDEKRVIKKQIILL